MQLRADARAFRCNAKHGTQLLLQAKDSELEELLRSLQEGGLEVNAFHVSVLLRSRRGWQASLVTVEEWRGKGVRSSAVLWNSVLNGCVKDTWSKSLAMVRSLKDLKVQPDTVTLDLSLRASRWAEACHLLSSAANVVPGAYGGSFTIAACGAEARWAEALQVFPPIHGASALHGANALLEAFPAAQWPHAEALFATCCAAGIQVDATSCSTLLSAGRRTWGTSQGWRRTLQLFEDLSARALQLNRICYNCILAAGKGPTQWAMGLRWLQRMEEEPDVKPDVVSYRCLMGMLDETSWPLALELLQFLQTQGRVDDATWSAVISSCGDAEAWQAALMLAEMCQQGAETGIRSHTSALSAYRKAGHWARAVANAVAREACEDPVAASVAMLALEDGSRWAQALLLAPSHGPVTADTSLDVWARAEQWQLAIDVAVLRGVRRRSSSSAVLAHSSWAVALQLGEQEQHLRGDLKRSNAVVSACADASKWEQALGVWSFTATSDRWALLGALLGACGKARRWAAAVAVLREATMPRMETELYNAALRALSAGPWLLALALLQEAEDLRLADGETYSLAADACVSGGQGQRAEGLFQQISSALLTPLQARKCGQPRLAGSLAPQLVSHLAASRPRLRGRAGTGPVQSGTAAGRAGKPTKATRARTDPGRGTVTGTTGAKPATPPSNQTPWRSHTSLSRTEGPSEWGESSRAHGSQPYPTKGQGKGKSKTQGQGKAAATERPIPKRRPRNHRGTRNPEKQALRVERGKARRLAAAQRTPAEAEEFEEVIVEVTSPSSPPSTSSSSSGTDKPDWTEPCPVHSPEPVAAEPAVEQPETLPAKVNEERGQCPAPVTKQEESETKHSPETELPLEQQPSAVEGVPKAAPGAGSTALSTATATQQVGEPAVSEASEVEEDTPSIYQLFEQAEELIQAIQESLSPHGGSAAATTGYTGSGRTEGRASKERRDAAASRYSSARSSSASS
ncbi:unnamed protein product [Durusdinium trenchii]|uniref:Pentatricopeptide repeat-containing protein, chloroplastic n=1 Tax=Durusdinium trenchii TaxID=1381693 RepID=A0ABP0HP59_9DINO